MSRTPNKDNQDLALVLVCLARRKRVWNVSEIEAEGINNAVLTIKRPEIIAFLGFNRIFFKYSQKDQTVEFTELVVDQDQDGSPNQSVELLKEKVDLPTGKVSLYGDTTLVFGKVHLRPFRQPPRRGASKPLGYVYPSQAESVALTLHRCQLGERRSMYVFGPTGTGKNTLAEAFASDLGYEFARYSFNAGSDIESLFSVVSLDADGTHKEFGSFASDLQGRVDPVTGELRPVYIVIDDVDRTPPSVMEVLRQILENTCKKVLVPELKQEFFIHPQTVIYATANTRGRGDNSSHYVSAEVQDVSMLNRFDRYVSLPHLTATQIHQVLVHRYPEAASSFGEGINQISKLASEILSNKSGLAVGLREILGLLEVAYDLSRFVSRSAKNWWPTLIREAAQSTLLGRFDDKSREYMEIQRLLNGHFDVCK